MKLTTHLQFVTRLPLRPSYVLSARCLGIGKLYYKLHLRTTQNISEPSYVTERGEVLTKEGRARTEFFPHALSLGGFLSLISLQWPTKLGDSLLRLYYGNEDLSSSLVT